MIEEQITTEESQIRGSSFFLAIFSTGIVELKTILLGGFKYG